MEFKAINWHWLIPDADSPCDIYLHFRGKFAKSVAKGAPISFAFFEKIRKTGFPYAYLKATDLKDWDNWLEKRHPIAAGKANVTESEDTEENSLYGNKRAELISYMQKVITPKNQNDPGLKFVFEHAPASVIRAIKTPMLDWYFNQFHEPPDLFYHNARVTFLTALFCQLYPVLSAKEQEQVLYSSIIHELQGDPTNSLDKVTSALTLDYLEKKQHPVPIEVLAAIKMHDELVSGRGYPNNLQSEAIPKPVRVFTFFNHFDHIRLKQTGTRRTRFEATKRALEERRADYDPALWTMFWEFLEQKIEVTA